MMAGKAELTAAPGVQNVVVYVSNDHFAQTYAVGQQPNILRAENEKSIQNNYGNGMEMLVDSTPTPPPPPRHLSDKPKNYFTSVLPPNALQQSVNNVYQNVSDKRQIHSGIIANPSFKTGNECEGHNTFMSDSHSGMTITGAEIPQQVVRCDSVRSETAESSCSSLSSADESLIVVQNQPEIVVYEPSIRQSGVVLALGSTASQITSSPANAVMETVSLNQNRTIAVPVGWKRILNNGCIFYVSPSNTVLSTSEQVKEYLLSTGTCKCGLECPLMYENVFSFDAKIGNKPWALLPDSNVGDLTKLCNHKRKMLSMASFIGKSPDPNVKIRKENSVNRKRQRMGLSYAVTASPISGEQEKISVNLYNHNKKALKNLNNQQVWQSPLNVQISTDRLGVSGCADNSQSIFQRQVESDNRCLSGSPMIINESDSIMMQSVNDISNPQIAHIPPSNSNIQIHHQIINPSNQILNIQGSSNQNNLVARQMQSECAQNQGIIQQQPYHSFESEQQQRILINNLPLEPTGPGRPNFQLQPNINIQPTTPIRHQKMGNQKLTSFYNVHQYQSNNQQLQHGLDVNKHLSSINASNIISNTRTHHHAIHQVPMHQKMRWQNPNKQSHVVQNQIQSVQQSNTYERVPPLHQLTSTPINWNEELKKKKIKLGKVIKSNRPYRVIDSCSSSSSSCPNIDVRQINSARDVIVNHQNSSIPSFMEDPSGYLAQQTALLNSTINRQTGGSDCVSFVNNHPSPLNQQEELNVASNSGIRNEVTLIRNVIPQTKMLNNEGNQNGTKDVNRFKSSIQCADSSALDQIQFRSFEDCHVESVHTYNQKVKSRPSSQPGTPHSFGSEDPVTSSTFLDKPQPSPDLRPIQGGTVSTSNISPMDSSSGSSNPPTPIPHTPTPPMTQRIADTSQICYQVNTNKDDTTVSPSPNINSSRSICYNGTNLVTSVVTTMASGRTVGSNTITSVLAGRANTATVSVNSPANHSNSPTILPTPNVSSNTVTISTSKTPLEMVQSVVTNLQVPQSQHSNYNNPTQQGQIIKQSPNLPMSHILVSSGGQLLMATTSNGANNGMAHSSKLITNSPNSMPPISASQMVTNVTTSMTQVIPAVAQQVLGQQTVLLNALPTPFVLQSGVTMTMDGISVAPNIQMPQLVSGNVIQQQIQMNNADDKRGLVMLSPEIKKKGKKRKMIQTVANMLQIGSTQQNSGQMIAMPQQGFSQQTIQMAHSPQGLTTTPVMQALTIVPNKPGTSSQILMNGQSMASNTAQQIINSQPTQQINLLQPVNLINGGGVVQNFPIQQFIVPNLGGMLMNPDGTATILQDTSNIGMQIQIQNVNGQNVLTPVQNNSVFSGNQNILSAGPAGMVIRAPSQGKIIHHSPGAQFLSPNGNQFVVNGTQFNGQLSPLVASVSPSQQVSFGAPTQTIRASNPQEFIQCGQTLMVPCTPSATPGGNISVSSPNQNNNFVQQNTTIVQQQTTMVSNNHQQLANIQNTQNLARSASIKVDQNYAINLNDNKQVQAIAVYRENFQNSSEYRQSVSTQTAVNQNAQSITTNTFCQTSTISTSSPPDTTTLSPIASEACQSSPSVDTTSHSISMDERLSPPSATSTTGDNSIKNQQQSCKMAMVNCISSSEPDLSDVNSQSDIDWRYGQQTSAGVVTKSGYIETTNCQQTPQQKMLDHINYPESSSVVSSFQIIEPNKTLHEFVGSRDFEKSITNRIDNNLIMNSNRHIRHSVYDIDKG